MRCITLPRFTGRSTTGSPLLSALCGLAILTLVAGPASAAKEKFERTKPHVNSSSAATGDLLYRGDADGGDSFGTRDDGHRGPGGLKNPGPDEPGYPPPTARLSGETLHVQGSQGANYILVELNGDNVDVTIEVKGSGAVLYAGSFPAAQIGDLRIFGLAGGDIIENDTSIPDAIWGGLGNDDIIAGNGPSFLFGQDGDDILNGRNGNDALYGDGGTDYCFGGNGADFVDGGDATDIVSGGYTDGTSDNVVDMVGGGAGADYFVDPPPELAADTLFDFDPMEDDYWN